MTAAELGERMDGRELMHWIAYDSINRSESWYQSAQICREIHWALNDPGSRIEDFIPPSRTFGPVEPSPDLEVQLMAWAMSRNATVAATIERLA